MEGLLHPVGSEEARTYWIRRGAAVLVMSLLLLAVGSMIANIGRADPSVAAEPAPADNAGPAEPAPAPVAASDKVVDEEAVPLPAGAERPEQKPPAAAQPPAEDNATEPTPKPAGPSQPAASTAASEEPLPPEPENTFHQGAQATRAGDRGPALCDPMAMRISLDGPKQVQKGVAVMYRVGVTNTSDRDCALQINEESFELKVFSGVDRIWSSLDCVTGMPPRGAVLAPGRSMDWEMEWRADRSAPQCKTNPEPMGSGTYVATAQFVGAKPAQLVMQLKA